MRMMRTMLWVAVVYGSSFETSAVFGREPTSEASAVPGVVINHSPAASRQYIGSPSIAVLPGGEYVVSHDYFGPGSTRDRTLVFASGDKGQTWGKRAEIQGQ